MKREKRPNAVLRRLREGRNQTREEFAQSMAEAARELGENCACSPRYVARLEDGDIEMPRPSYRRVLEQATGLPFDKLGWGTATQAGAPTTPDVARTLAELLPQETDVFAALQSSEGRRIGPNAVADMFRRVHGLRLADDVIAGGDLMSPAFRELHSAVRLYQESAHTEEVGRAMLSSIGEFAQIVGWIASDAGEHRQAERAYRLGISAAEAAGDGTLAGNLIGSLAYQLANTGREREAVTLTQAAVDAAGPTAPGRARALYLDRLAWAQTKAHDAQAATRALSEAGEAMAAYNPGADEPEYLYWVDAAELHVMEARVYTELRRPLRAVPLLTDALSRYDATHARELALYLSWLAVAYADANEPEQAAETAERMITLSGSVSSERTNDRARTVLRRLQSLGDVPELNQLLDSYSHLLLTT